MKHLFPGLALVLSATLLTAGCDRRNPKVAETPPPVVMVATPVQRFVHETREFTARSQAVKSVNVKPRVTGYLTKICFEDGAMVKENDVLFEIDDRPYKAALEQAEGAVEVGKASLIKTQADYDIAVNIKKLNAMAISQEDLNKAMGARDESKGQLDKAKANLENAKLNYGWCKVTSPIEGRAARHLIDVGNLVNQDMTVLTNVVSLKPMWVYFDVDQNTATAYEALAKKGEVIEARSGKAGVDLLLPGNKNPYIGKIDYVSNQADPGTASITVRATFPNDDGMLFAGLFGRIKVPVSAEHMALLVADSAVGTNQAQRYVLVVGSDNTVEYRIVDVGQIHHGLREVMPTREVDEPGKDGRLVTKTVEVLKADDRIIVDGLQRVRPGIKVEPKSVDMITLLRNVPEAKTDPKTKIEPKVEPTVDPKKIDVPPQKQPEKLVPPPPPVIKKGS